MEFLLQVQMHVHVHVHVQRGRSDVWVYLKNPSLWDYRVSKHTRVYPKEE